MFRRIHSKRNPKDTLYTELKREFSPHFRKAGAHMKTASSKHARLIFWLMVINIALSVLLSFTVFHHPESPELAKKPLKVLSPVTTGFGQLMETSDALREMLQLKRNIDSLSAKKQLGAKDSVSLENALDRFQQLDKKFNQRK